MTAVAIIYVVAVIGAFAGAAAESRTVASLSTMALLITGMILAIYQLDS